MTTGSRSAPPPRPSSTGTGSDTIGLWFNSEGATVDIEAGWVSNATLGRFDAVGFENVGGSPGDDVIYGDAGRNRLYGNQGHVDSCPDGRGGGDVCDAEVIVGC